MAVIMLVGSELLTLSNSFHVLELLQSKNQRKHWQSLFKKIITTYFRIPVFIEQWHAVIILCARAQTLSNSFSYTLSMLEYSVFIAICFPQAFLHLSFGYSLLQLNSSIFNQFFIVFHAITFYSWSSHSLIL